MLFHRETNSKSGKIYLLASMKYTWSGAHVSCGVASFQIETPKDIDDFTIRPTLIDQISVLGGVVVPIVDIESLKKC